MKRRPLAKFKLITLNGLLIIILIHLLRMNDFLFKIGSDFFNFSAHAVEKLRPVHPKFLHSKTFFLIVFYRIRRRGLINYFPPVKRIAYFMMNCS